MNLHSLEPESSASADSATPAKYNSSDFYTASLSEAGHTA